MQLLSWNVQWCRGIDGRVDAARIVRDARAVADFDVLCLQEVAQHYPGLPGGADHDQVALLAALLPGYELHFAPAVDERAEDGSQRQRFGNLIASRCPAALVRSFALPWVAEAAAPGAPLPTPVPSMPRVALELTLATPIGPLRLVTTHLEYYSPTQRLAQVHALRGWHADASALALAPPHADAENAGGPFRHKLLSRECIVCGDFNFRPGSDEYLLMLAESGHTPRWHDAWTLVHGNHPQPPTFHLHESGEAPYACDFVFVSDGLTRRVREVRVEGATQASDHQPVLVRFGD